MNLPLDTIAQKKMIPAWVLSGLCLLGLFLLILSGCESPSGAPGSRPGAVVPGRPGPPGGAKLPGSPLASNAPKPLNSSTFSSSASSPLKPGGSQGPQIETAATLLSPKPDSSTLSPNPLLPANAETDKPSKSEASDVNSLGLLERVEQAGNTVELASLIIHAKGNPFLDWLPRPLIVPDASAGGSTTPANTAAPVDPFQGVNLLGIIYHGKNAMALMAVGDGQTQFVQTGSLVNLATGSAKVLALRPDGIDLQLLDKSAQSRTFTLPDIIGYTPASSSGGISQEDSAAPAPQSALPSGSTTQSALDNLKKLVEQSGISPQSGPGSATQVNLQER